MARVFHMSTGRMTERRTLGQVAFIVWSAAQRGRQDIRAGKLLSAKVWLEGLLAVEGEIEGPESLRRLVSDAVDEINGRLFGTSRPRNGGDAA